MVLESYHREREGGNEEREKRGGLCWHELFGSGLFAEGEKMVSNLQGTKDNVMYPLLKSSDTWDVGKNTFTSSDAAAGEAVFRGKRCSS